MIPRKRIRRGVVLGPIMRIISLGLEPSGHKAAGLDAIVLDPSGCIHYR
jgi:hypothetical protein